MNDRGILALFGEDPFLIDWAATARKPRDHTAYLFFWRFALFASSACLGPWG